MDGPANLLWVQVLASLVEELTCNLDVLLLFVLSVQFAEEDELSKISM